MVSENGLAPPAPYSVFLLTPSNVTLVNFQVFESFSNCTSWIGFSEPPFPPQLEYVIKTPKRAIMDSIFADLIIFNELKRVKLSKINTLKKHLMPPIG